MAQIDLTRSMSDAIAAMRDIARLDMATLLGWRAWEISNRATITVEPLRPVRIDRFVMPRATTSDWIIHDIAITNGESANTNILPYALPGETFAIDTSPPFNVPEVVAGREIKISVEYVGNDPDGGQFTGALHCTEIDGDGRQRRAMLPVHSEMPLFSARRVNELGPGCRIGLQLDDRFSLYVDHTELRCAQPTMEEMLWIDSDNGKGTVMRSGEPRKIDRMGAFKSTRVNVDAFAGRTEPPDRRCDEVRDLWAVRPMTVSLHLLETSHPVLFGVDETDPSRSSVVFEIGIPPFQDGGSAFFGRFDRHGYRPSWWQ